MKNKSIIIKIFFLIIIVILGFFLLEKNKDHVAIQAKNIKAKVELIDNEKDYQIKKLDSEKVNGEQITDGGGQLIGYFKDGNISKIEEHLGLSHGVKTYQYYFVDDELILVEEKDEGFSDPLNTGTLDYTKLELVFKGQYYFKKGKLFNTETIGVKRFPQEENINIEDFFLKAAQENIELLRS